MNLQPCPVCGGAVHDQYPDSYRWAFIECAKCTCIWEVRRERLPESWDESCATVRDAMKGVTE